MLLLSESVRLLFLISVAVPLCLQAARSDEYSVVLTRTVIVSKVVNTNSKQFSQPPRFLCRVWGALRIPPFFTVSCSVPDALACVAVLIVLACLERVRSAAAVGPAELLSPPVPARAPVWRRARARVRAL